MDPNSSYAILGRMAGDGAFTRTVDNLIEEENAAFIDTLCPGCSGSGKKYFPPEIKGDPWIQAICGTCGGTGQRCD